MAFPSEGMCKLGQTLLRLLPPPSSLPRSLARLLPRLLLLLPSLLFLKKPCVGGLRADEKLPGSSLEPAFCEFCGGFLRLAVGLRLAVSLSH